jgi:hypothetical protein
MFASIDLIETASDTTTYADIVTLERPIGRPNSRSRLAIRYAVAARLLVFCLLWPTCAAALDKQGSALTNGESHAAIRSCDRSDDTLALASPVGDRRPPQSDILQAEALSERGASKAWGFDIRNRRKQTQYSEF